MKTILIPLITVCLTGWASAQEPQATPRNDRDTTAGPISAVDQPAGPTHDATLKQHELQMGHDNGKKDNTARNSRDKNGGTLTPEDQSNSPQDIKISADLRKTIVGDKKLSVIAKNIKIITIGGVVTLRGPVQSPQEKTEIETASKSVQGISQLKNELEVKQP